MQKLALFKHIIAVEPSSDLAKTCAKKGLNVIEEPIENVTFIEKADVITNFELIEHLFWPEDYISACASLLNTGGLFICTTPNIKGFDLLMLGEVSDNISGPNHLNYFNPKSFCHLLQRCGFRILETLTPGELDGELVRKKVLSGEFSLNGQPFLEEVLIHKWNLVGNQFQQFLRESGLSSHMWIVGQKL